MTAAQIMEIIRRNAQDQADGILRAAHTQAEGIQQQMLQEAQTSHANRCEGAHRSAAIQAEHSLSIARMDARQIRNEARAAMIRQCLSAARDQFEDLVQSPDYPRILDRLLEQGIAGLGLREGVVLCHPRDLPLLESLVSGRPGRSLRVAAASNGEIPTGGFLLRSRDGRITVDQRWEERLRRLEGDLIPELASLLFPEESDATR